MKCKCCRMRTDQPFTGTSAQGHLNHRASQILSLFTTLRFLLLLLTYSSVVRFSRVSFVDDTGTVSGSQLAKN